MNRQSDILTTAQTAQQSRSRIDALLADPAAPLALMLCAWRGWLDAAIADGAALAHFKSVAPMLKALSFERASPAVMVLALPPSPRAIAAGWPASEPVRIAFAAVPPVHIGAHATSRTSVRSAVRALVRMPAVRARTLLVERVEDQAALAMLATGRPPVRHLTASEIAAALPKARQLAKALARTPNATATTTAAKKASPPPRCGPPDGATAKNKFGASPPTVRQERVPSTNRNRPRPAR